MSASFVLVLENEKTKDMLEMLYLSTTPCRTLMNEYGLDYTEDYLPFGENEYHCFVRAVDEFTKTKAKYEAEMNEAKEMALKAVAPESFMERYDNAKEMYDWANEELDHWSGWRKVVEYAMGVAEDNKGWVLKYYSCQGVIWYFCIKEHFANFQSQKR